MSRLPPVRAFNILRAVHLEGNAHPATPLVVSWGLATWRPHAVLFLVDSIWFAIMAGHLVVSVLNGWNPAWLSLLVPLLWMAVTGLKHYYRFRNVAIAPPGKPWT